MQVGQEKANLVCSGAGPMQNVRQSVMSGPFVLAAFLSPAPVQSIALPLRFQELASVPACKLNLGEGLAVSCASSEASV